MGAVPRVVVLGLGGTIAMTPSESGGVVPKLSVRQLIESVPGLTKLGVDLEVRDFRQVASASLTFDDLRDLRETIEEYLAAGVDGVVITQGTDTIEETSYALDLAYGGATPVVVTGAMRGAAQAGADGPANLLAAVRVAASPVAREHGVLVVMADEIHAASHVRKTHTTSLGTFQSPNFGPLGHVVEGRVRLAKRAGTRMLIEPAGSRSAPRVGLVTMSLDEDGFVLNAMLDQVDGAVIAGVGVGHVPRDLVPVIAKLATNVPVVLSSRIPTGPSLRETYGYPGSEQDLLGRGLISAGFLDPLKARILLRALLSAGRDRAAIVKAFAVAGGHDQPSLSEDRQ